MGNFANGKTCEDNDYLGPPYRRALDYTLSNINDMRRILGRSATDGGLAVGNTIKPNQGTQPGKPPGEACCSINEHAKLHGKVEAAILDRHTFTVQLKGWKERLGYMDGGVMQPMSFGALDYALSNINDMWRIRGRSATDEGLSVGTFEPISMNHGAVRSARAAPEVAVSGAPGPDL